MARELGLRRGGAREAAEDARALAGRSERGWVLGRQFVEDGSVQFDLRRRGRLRNALGGAGQAIGAVAARIGAGLAEVGDERLHLAAIVLDERDDARDPLRLRLLAPVESLGEAVAQLVERRWLLQQREALAHVGDLQLDEAPLLEVAER